MTKIKVEGVFFNTQNKDGVPYKNKNGQPFTMINVLHDNGKKASMYCENERDGWKIDKLKQWRQGDEVEVEISESNGFTNFSLPSKKKILEDENAALKAKLAALTGGKEVSNKETVITDEDLDSLAKTL